MKKKILVIEDDNDILDAIELALSVEGYEVQITPDSDKAIPMTEQFAPDLIILDFLLSGGDGIEICNHIKSREKLKQIPILMMSAHPSAEKLVGETKADAFIPKPFELSRLLSEVRRLVRNPIR